MSSKNTLQELCMSEGYDLPSYTTKRIGGPAHDPEWLSTVTTKLKNGKSVTVPGKICASKTEAEKSAATEALESLVLSSADDSTPEVKENVETKDTNANNEDVQIYILIDVENLPNMIFPSVSWAKKRKDIKIYAFIGQNHHSVEKDYGKNVNKIIVPTTRKDGVDTYIQMFVGKALSSTIKISYAIVTRDHFGHSLAELIWTPSPTLLGNKKIFPSMEAAVITTEEQLNVFIKKCT